VRGDLAIRDGAKMLKAYAAQTKNKQLETDAAEIRIRAERRLGQLIAQQRETVGLAKGARERGFRKNPRSLPTLAAPRPENKFPDARVSLWTPTRLYASLWTPPCLIRGSSKDPAAALMFTAWRPSPPRLHKNRPSLLEL
jgi:hypothetical protein